MENKIYRIQKIMGDTTVFILDSMSEVMELHDFKEATELARLLEVNSDSGYKYKVKQIK